MGKSPETFKPSTYINYNSLKREDRLLFAHSGLDRFISTASTLLKNRVSSAETHKLDRPYFSDSSLLLINTFIEELLTIIGTHSNIDFGPEPLNQDRYFRRASERNGFPTHLFISRWQEGAKALICKDPHNAKKIENADASGLLFSKKRFKDIPAASKLTYGPSKLTEVETRAVGVLYMIELVSITLRDNRDLLTNDRSQKMNIAEVFQSGVTLFSLLDESDRMASHSDGGRSGNKTRRFDDAEQIIRKLVEKNPEKSTKILAARAKQSIEYDDYDGLKPKDRWIEDKVRAHRKILQRK